MIAELSPVVTRLVVDTSSVVLKRLEAEEFILLVTSPGEDVASV